MCEPELFGEPLCDPVRLAPYDESWPEGFREHRKRLEDALGSVALRIDHVGSTSVPKLPSKPVIDIQISVNDLEDEDSYRPHIEALGWPMRARLSDRRFFRVASGERDAHIHVVEIGDEGARRNLLFPAYLRANPEIRDAYAKLKRDLAKNFGDDRIEYTERKSPFIEETLRLAEEWTKETGWRS
ncbi:MAG: GrpB family protein [Rubrobacteraceae bacterium]